MGRLPYWEREEERSSIIVINERPWDCTESTAVRGCWAVLGCSRPEEASLRRWNPEFRTWWARKLQGGESSVRGGGEDNNHDGSEMVTM